MSNTFWPIHSKHSGEKVAYKTLTDENLREKKILIVYFSWSGTTRQVAEYIQSCVGGDLYEIVPRDPYVGSHSEVSNLAKKELDAEYRPPLAKALPNVKAYDVVFIGYPIWWYQEPVVVDTFIESAKLEDKYIIPFCTSGGSTIEKSEARIAGFLPDAHVVKGITLSGAHNFKKIDKWLNDSGF
ncbi:flavodoxin [Veillonella ratti]|uniref:flavodoxin n=1 Tax=Veillonella ratti TaxID=103892 RepID=UPI000F8D236F|nr:flavodoxin [Veillonella ratti]